MNYTKGKWILTKQFRFLEINTDKNHICKIDGTIPGPFFDDENGVSHSRTMSHIEVMEIGKLIIKAPEMYEALKLYIIDLKNVVPESPARNSRIDQIESLINEIENEG